MQALERQAARVAAAVTGEDAFGRPERRQPQQTISLRQADDRPKSRLNSATRSAGARP